MKIKAIFFILFVFISAHYSYAQSNLERAVKLKKDAQNEYNNKNYSSSLSKINKAITLLKEEDIDVPSDMITLQRSISEKYKIQEAKKRKIAEEERARKEKEENQIAEAESKNTYSEEDQIEEAVLGEEVKLNNWRTHIEGIEFKEFNLDIYNRWGKLIWESQDPNTLWDGTYGVNSEKKVPEGTYFWKIIASDLIGDDKYQWQGHVTIIY